MPNSYYSVRTNAMKPFRAFESDFKSAGDFKETIDECEICLEHHLMPGSYQSGAWVEAVESNDETYLFILEYKSQDQIEIYLQCQSNDPKLINNFGETLAFVKGAAEKFFLVNDIIPSYIEKCYDKELKKTWNLAAVKEPVWEDVEDLINDANNTSFYGHENIDVNSWHKTMTVVEAKELFDYLEIKIKFPS